MSDRPRLSELDLWGKYQSACLEVLRTALRDLVGDRNAAAVDIEDDINRQLFRCLDRAEYNRDKSEIQIGAVTYEGRNSPAATDPCRVPREYKRPDFYWAWIDDLAADDQAARREFVVECKRLSPTSAGRSFPDDYITHGVMRFIEPDHGYGKGMAAGAMIGYLQLIPLNDALSAVNAAARSSGVSPLELRSRSGNDQAELDHRFDRSFEVTPFHLAHVWERLM